MCFQPPILDFFHKLYQLAFDRLRQRWLSLSKPDLCKRSNDHHLQAISEIIAPQGALVLIDDPEQLDIGLLKRKSVAVHWEFMFTRSLFQTPDMQAQGNLLNEVAQLVDAGKIHSTQNQTFGTINAQNLKKAHALLESNQSIGKIVLSGFEPS